MANIKPIKLIVLMGKLKYLEVTHAHMGITCKLLGFTHGNVIGGNITSMNRCKLTLMNPIFFIGAIRVLLGFWYFLQETKLFFFLKILEWPVEDLKVNVTRVLRVPFKLMAVRFILLYETGLKLYKIALLKNQHLFRA